MLDVYELQWHPKGWAIVHKRSGYIAEVWRNKWKAKQMLNRFNTCI